MTIYKTRYQARKEKRGHDVIVKVCGGYTIMDPGQYNVWRKQK